jgi:hypothetical protein
MTGPIFTTSSKALGALDWCLSEAAHHHHTTNQELRMPRMTEMVAPRVVHDTLFGTTARDGDVAPIPLDQVTAVQVRVPDRLTPA